MKFNLFNVVKRPLSPADHTTVHTLRLQYRSRQGRSRYNLARGTSGTKETRTSEVFLALGATGCHRDCVRVRVTPPSADPLRLCFTRANRTAGIRHPRAQSLECFWSVESYRSSCDAPFPRPAAVHDSLEGWEGYSRPLNVLLEMERGRIYLPHYGTGYF